MKLKLKSLIVAKKSPGIVPHTMSEKHENMFDIKSKMSQVFLKTAVHV